MDIIYAHAERHHGVISRSEAMALGISRSRFDNAIRSGRLQSVAPRVFAVAGSPNSWHKEARIAALRVDGLISHRAAAFLHGIDGFGAGDVEVVVAKYRRPRVDGFTLHRSTRIHFADEVEIDSLPVTGLARTVLDVGAVVSPRRLEWVIDAVLRQELCSLAELHSVLQVHSIQGRNGCGPLREILEHRIATDPIPDSAWNRMVGQLLRSWGLPEPLYEYVVRSGSDFLARVDLAYPDQRIAIELDSVRWHLNRESFEKDPRRKNRLINQGWTVLTFTWADYRDRPGDLVGTVATALRKAA